METVVLVIHLLLALALIGVVLLQRSEGGGLGIGGGGGNAMAGRSVATALSKATWALAAAFIVTSLALTIIAAQNASSGSVVDRISDTGGSLLPPAQESTLGGGGLLPPSATEPLVPVAPAPEAPAAN